MEHISFLASPRYKHEVYDSKAGAVIVSDKAVGEFTGCSLIVAANPYLYLAKAARPFSPVVKACGGVHPTAAIELSITVPDSYEIGANTYIGANTVLDEDRRILANAVVQHDCKLGSEVILHPSAVVYYGYTLDNRVKIHSGAVIGTDGFGLAFTGGSWFKIPQAGTATLGNDVEIGSNSNVDRGAMSDTTVSNGIKTDNQVQIGHDCKIGSHTVIAAKAGIPGNVTAGNYCIIGGGVDTVSRIETADKTIVDGGTSIIHSTTRSGQHVAGTFLMSSYKERVRNAVHIHCLDETGKRIKQFEQESAKLKSGKQAA